MIPAFRYIVRRVTEPLYGNTSFFVFLCALFVLSELLRPDAQLADYPFGALFVDVFLLSWVLSFLPGRPGRWVRGGVAACCAAVCAADTYAAVRLGSGLTPTMLQLVMETNADEAAEFWSAYVWCASTARVLLPFLLWGMAWMAWRCFGLPRMRGMLRPGRRWRIVLRAVYAVVVWGAFITAFVCTREHRSHASELLSQTTSTGMERFYNKGYARELYSPLHRLYFSVWANGLMADQLVRLRSCVEQTRVDSCAAGVPTVVLVIGESYNKHHSQLYGYTKPTTPRQCARATAGELVPFTDVVTCWNLTSHVFRYLFSLHSIGTRGAWCDETLFPALFRQVGYRVAFLTNQYVRRPDDDAFDFSGGYFLNDDEMSGRLFDVRNTRKHRFDDGLLADYDSLCAGRPEGERQLVMFHLIGQHVGYDKRYPAGRRRFRPEDYNRPDLKPEQVQTVADYDNATLYNDSVVDAILRRFERQDAVVIYVPDHGEEVYDGLKVFGRLHSSALTPRMVRNEFEIPFWIWCSPVCRRTRPQLAGQLARAADLPFMADDLPHTLLYLAGIRCPGYDERRVPLSPLYDAARRRLLKGYKDYDLLMEEEKKKKEDKG